MSRAVCLGLVDRLVDGGGFRNPVEKKYLEKGQAENIQDGGGYLFFGKIARLLYDPVEPEAPSVHPLNELFNKTPVPIIQLRVSSVNIVKAVVDRYGFTGLPVQHL